MAVAKSYENMEQIGQPYEENGKMYIRVKGKCPRCGGSGNYSYNQIDGTRCYGCNGTGIKVMDVRWYTDAERARQDRAAEKRAEKAVEVKETRRIKFAARNAFGFGEAGYIMLLKGKNETIKNWVHAAEPGRAYFNMVFKWYVPSTKWTDTYCADTEMPEGIEPICLRWEDVCNKDDEENLTMNDDATVIKLVDSLINEPSVSEYQGTVGEWMTKSVEIKKNIELDGRYGTSHMHIMEDEVGNVYVWISSSKSLEEESVHTLKMKVKEHKEYNNTKQTVVWYCKEAA